MSHTPIGLGWTHLAGGSLLIAEGDRKPAMAVVLIAMAAVLIAADDRVAAMSQILIAMEAVHIAIPVTHIAMDDRMAAPVICCNAKRNCIDVKERATNLTQL